jgi:hypothetical protein
MVNFSSRRIIQAVAIMLGSLSLGFGQADLRVNEAGTRLHIEPKGPELALTLRLPSRTSHPEPSPLTCWWISWTPKERCAAAPTRT